MVIHPAAFHSDIEVNLDGTDEEELYDTMVERMIEKMATLQSMGSDGDCVVSSNWNCIL